jgi:predicted nucleotidyltransferase
VSKPNPKILSAISEVLQIHSEVELAILFGSVALGGENRESDIDVAIDVGRPLTATEKMEFVAQIAEKTGRAVDVIDLHVAGEPILGQILTHGTRILGSKTKYGDLIRKHLFDTADFMPYRSRILRERRRAWTGQ